MPNLYGNTRPIDNQARNANIDIQIKLNIDGHDSGKLASPSGLNLTDEKDDVKFRMQSAVARSGRKGYISARKKNLYSLR